MTPEQVSEVRAAWEVRDVKLALGNPRYDTGLRVRISLRPTQLRSAAGVWRLRLIA